MGIRILASLVLLVAVVNSTNCPSEHFPVSCYCRDFEDPPDTVGMYCTTNNLADVHFISRRYGDRISEFGINVPGIFTLPSFLFGFSRLTSLNIAGENLTSVQKDAFHGVRNTLVSLKFSETNLRRIPDDLINSLTKLKILYIRNALIGSLTDSLQNTFLESLTVYKSGLATIASGAFPRTLRYLFLRKNKLRNLNGALRKYLPNLTTIHISENEIRGLHGVFEGTPNLHRLYAENNMIATIEDFALATVPYLAYLRLSYNRIREIREGLNVVPLLEEMELDHNRIDTVSETAFQNSTRLRLLKMNNNRIRQLPESVFDCLTSLQFLDLSDNFLSKIYYLSPPSTTIEQNLESNTPTCDFWKDSSLQTFNVAGNGLDCSQRTKQIFRALRSKKVMVGGGSTCLKRN